jgi:hypothetical protein
MTGHAKTISKNMSIFSTLLMFVLKACRPNDCLQRLPFVQRVVISFFGRLLVIINNSMSI